MGAHTILQRSFHRSSSNVEDSPLPVAGWAARADQPETEGVEAETAVQIDGDGATVTLTITVEVTPHS